MFDSDKDNWNKNKSVFDSKVMNKSNLAFIVEDTQNNKYGYYFNGTITKCDSFIISKNSFLFSLKSNGRINGMMKFEEKDNAYGLKLFDKSYSCLFGMDYGFWIFKENWKTSSFVYEKSNYFDFHGTTKAFHQDLSNDGYRVDFTPKRFVVIQMQ